MIIDLSLPIFDGMPVYEGDPEVSVTKVRTRETHGWELRELRLGSHTGTHVDAPSHMHEGGANLDHLDLTKFYGPAKLVRSSEAVFPEKVGLIFEDEVGTNVAEAVIKANPPFVGGDISDELERQLLGQGIVTFTNLTNLHRLRNVDFIFSGFLLKITEGDGSPVRAVAIINH